LISKKTVTALLIAFLLISALSLAIVETVEAETTITFAFDPSDFSVGDPVTCIAKVTGSNDLAGNVTWSVNDNYGTFSSAQANLSTGIFPVIFSGSSGYTYFNTATYSGDANNPSCTYTRFFDPNSGIYIMPVGGYDTGHGYEYWILVDFPVTLKANVRGNNPAGTVTWSTSSPTGNFNSTQPLLKTVTAGTWGESATALIYSDSTLGNVSITATYSGDSINNPDRAITDFITIAAGSELKIWQSDYRVPMGDIIIFKAVFSGYDVTQDTTWSTYPPNGRTRETSYRSSIWSTYCLISKPQAYRPNGPPRGIISPASASVWHSFKFYDLNRAR
jgi:hypothetical protein